MKLRKISALIIAVGLAANLAACSKPTSDRSTDSGYGNPQGNTITQPPSVIAQQGDEATGQTAPEVVYITYPFQSLAPFSEDRAWVKYGGNNPLSTALIDNTGNVLFHTDMDILYCSQFEDGFSYCLVKGDPDYTWFIIDRAGNITSSNFDTSGATSDKPNNYVLLGYADGHFIVTEHVANFDKNEWLLGTIDENGNVKNELKVRPDLEITELVKTNYYKITKEEYYDIIWHAGDGIVSLMGKGLYSVREDKALALKSKDGVSYFNGVLLNLNFYGGFNNGSTLISCDSGAFVMSSAYLSGDFSNKEIYKFAPYDIAGPHSESMYFTGGFPLTEGQIVYNDNYYSRGMGYCDLSGNLITFPEYDGREFAGAPFRGGYAVMSVKGVDGATYVTAIDKTGKRLYEPLKTDGVDINESSHGYVFAKINGGRLVVSPDGTILRPGHDDLSAIGNDVAFGDISSGFIKAKTGYISLDCKIIIESINIPSEAPVEKVIPASTYTSSFSMAGMWKSDNGTILSFNANGAVGPMLFGFEGGPDGSWTISSKADGNGHYTLNASHLAGGNIVYTVRLLGKDEIELYEESGDSYGSSYYHLIRQ
ncbi:hypothetical protein FACS1894132_02380 [Clostridia bacterium]|nr:hypothetical protein FACS1894132_02380 [Clostridia bacterium]